MKYFETLPAIAKDDPNGFKIAAINLLARASIIPELILNPALYYEYDIQDGDTPEIVASKYYNDSYRYWIVLFSNQILDPQWDWPLSYIQFEPYINEKYATAAANVGMTPLEYTKTTVYEYRKIIKTLDSTTSNTTTDYYVVDANTYNDTIISSKTVNFPPTKWSPYSSVTYSTDKQIVSIYDWENEQNEKKRTIKILNALYVGQFEQQFNYLMSN